MQVRDPGYFDSHQHQRSTEIANTESNLHPFSLFFSSLFSASTASISDFPPSLFVPRAVKFTSKLFGRALSRRIKATVLYATETGRSEAYARQLVELLGHAFNAQVRRMVRGNRCLAKVNSWSDGIILRIEGGRARRLIRNPGSKLDPTSNTDTQEHTLECGSVTLGHWEH